jgi:hypothetical protein
MMVPNDSMPGTGHGRLAIALIAALVVLGVAVVGVQMWRATSVTPDAAPEVVEPTGAPFDSSSSTTPVAESLPVATVPEDTVDAFYDAAGAGDLAAVRATLASEADFDEELLAGWGEPSHTITLVTAGPKTGELWVEVEETSGGMPGSVSTFTLVESGGVWLIADISRGAVVDQKEFGADAVVNPQLSRPEQKSLEVVLEFLGARGVGSVSHMKDLATARMEKEHAALFKMRTYDVEISVTAAWTEGDSIIISTKEEWNSEKETHEYVVVEKDGKYLVDDQR